MKRSAIALGTSLFFACSLVAQAPVAKPANASSTSTPKIKVNAEEVTLDMEFQDKHGKPITDIRPSEVHVYENGTEENLNSFRWVSGRSATNVTAEGNAQAGASIPLDPMRQLRLVTLVFENLDQDGKRFFSQALDDMLKVAPEQNLYFSVVVIDHKLNMIQPFTNDRKQLLKSVKKSAMWSYIEYAKSSAQIKEQLRNTLSGGESASQSDVSGDTTAPPSISAGNRSGPSAASIQGSVQWQMAKMEYDMLQQADTAEQQADARTTIDALLALVRAESKLPGRKVVLYFNPWLNIPEIAKEQYHYMVSEANRANITFYTVDPKGLTTWSQEGAGRSQLSGATGEIFNQQITGGVGEVTTSQARVDETAESGIRANPRLWLDDLSHETGGVTIADTNDLEKPMRTVMDEVNSYYEASYNPHITVFDGKFRKISVKIDRPGVVVHTRSGYFALPRLASGQQVYAYEVPLLKALDSSTPQEGLHLYAAAQRFNDQGSLVNYMITLQVPEKDITFAPQPDGKTAKVDAPLIAVVKDSNGNVVRKFSKDFAVTVPAANIEGYKMGDLTQSYQTELSPGNYTLESAIMDLEGNKIGVKKSSFTVPSPSQKLSMSDVVIVMKNEKLAKDAELVNPFYYPGGKVVPTLNTTLKGGPGHYLPFYFTVYTDPAIKAAPKLTMLFYKDGQFLGKADAPLPPAQADGRIPYIAALPADNFTPGSYRITLGITQGTAQVQQDVSFQID